MQSGLGVARLVPRPKLGQEVARHLRDALLDGRFKAGQRIPLEDLARELGVSSMPVREALVALASEGLLEVIPRRGFRVAEIHERDVGDVYQVNAFIAGLLVEDAAARISGDTLALLRSTQNQIQDLAGMSFTQEDYSERVEALNFFFHRTINHVAQATRLRWFVRVSSRYVPRYFYKLPGWTAATIADHPGIIDALEAKDGALARQLMEAHIKRAGDLVVAHLTQRGFWAAQESQDHRPNP